MGSPIKAIRITRVITPPLKGVLYPSVVESVKVMSETETKLMTVSDVAKRANVTTQIVYRWIAVGDLDYYNIGTGSKRASFRISEEHLEAFFENKEGWKL